MFVYEERETILLIIFFSNDKGYTHKIKLIRQGGVVGRMQCRKARWQIADKHHFPKSPQICKKTSGLRLQ
jgi:hypothetical protein